jgi:hypothetical protein
VYRNAGSCSAINSVSTSASICGPIMLQQKEKEEKKKRGGERKKREKEKN